MDENPTASALRRRAFLKLSALGVGLGALGFDRALAAIDPIPARIEPSEIAVELVEFAAPPRSAAKAPYALLNTLYHAGDGTKRIFTNDSRGKLWELDRDTGAARLVLDYESARPGRLRTSSNQMGLRSFAFHPDFGKAGRPGHRKFYTMACERPSDPADGAPVFDGPYRDAFHDVLVEWTATSNATFVATGPGREILRIVQHKSDHNADQIVFNVKAKTRGHPDYGLLYLGVGDGGNTPSRPDIFDSAQDKGRALGKILRLDPLRQKGGAPYRVPDDNPFAREAGSLPEIWALGLRHPQNIAFDPKGNRERMILSDIGQTQVEEVNLGIKGANYGWPAREGTFMTDRDNQNVVRPLPADDARYGYTYPVAQYDHDEGKAICGGHVYRYGAVRALRGHYLFGDLVNGRIFHVPVWKLWPGRQAAFKELRLLRNGRPTTMAALNGTSRVDLRFGQDERGEVYILSKQDGKVRRMRPG